MAQSIVDIADRGVLDEPCSPLRFVTLVALEAEILDDLVGVHGKSYDSASRGAVGQDVIQRSDGPPAWGGRRGSSVADRIGAEAEKFGLDAVTLRPVQYSGQSSILSIFERFQRYYGWTPVSEAHGSPVIALERGAASITLEPGGQLELSGAPLAVERLSERLFGATHPQERLDARGENRTGNGLDQIAVGTLTESEDTVAVADRRARDLQHLDGGHVGAGLQTAAHLEAVDVRQVHIAHDDVGMPLGRERQRVAPVRGFDDVEAGPAERGDLGEARRLLVVDDEHATTWCCSH